MRVRTVDKQLSVGFSKEALSQIKKLSDDGNISLAEWVRRVVYKELHLLNSLNSQNLETTMKKENKGGSNNGNF